MALLKLLIGLAVIWLTPWQAQAADPQLVVTAVSGQAAGLKAGQSLAAGATLDLPAGATVKLLSANGQVIVLKGPHSGPVETQAQSSSGVDDQVVARLAKFLGERQVQTGALGAIRSGPPRTREPTDAFMVVVGDQGQQCARGQVTLWRRNAERDASLEIRSAGAGSTRLAWPKGTNSMALPPPFALDRISFEVILDGVANSVNLHLAPASIKNPAALADWMVSQKCDRQAALFLSSL